MCSCSRSNKNINHRGHRGTQRNGKILCGTLCPLWLSSYALTTLPLRRQEVHTRMRLVVEPTRACTGRRLMFQRRLVTLWAWLMRFPACGFLPQISHCCGMTTPREFRSCWANYDFTGSWPYPAIRTVASEGGETGSMRYLVYAVPASS